MTRFNYMHIWLALSTALFISIDNMNAKNYMRCELTKLLVQKYKFDKSFISNWICLVEHESQLNTAKITPQPNQSQNYGLFQINSKNYCVVGRPGGFCNKKCEDFSNDDISDDVACAKIIQQREGFKYWKNWQRYCLNSNNLPNLNVVCNLKVLTKRSKRRIFYDFVK